MSKDLLSMAFNALAAVVLLGATLAYVAPPPGVADLSGAVGAAEEQSVPECADLASVECHENDDDRYDDSEDHEDDDDHDDEDDEDEDRSGKGNGNGKGKGKP